MNVTVHVKMNSEHILVFSAKNCNTMDKIYRYKKVSSKFSHEEKLAGEFIFYFNVAQIQWI